MAELDPGLLTELALISNPKPGSSQVARTYVTIEYHRDMNEADLQLLASVKGTDESFRPIDKIRQSHHNLARGLAEGKSVSAVAVKHGMNPTRLGNMLEFDPAFRELVEYYRQMNEEIYYDVHRGLATLGESVIQMIQEKLDNKDVTELDFKTLREIGEFALDRSTAPAKTGKSANLTLGVNGGGAKSVSVTVSFGEDNEAKPSPIIDVTPNGGESNEHS